MSADSTSAVPWITRVAALLEIAGDLGARASSTRSPRRRTALLGLRCLAAFAAKQFDLFGEGFEVTGVLEPDPRYPVDFLLEATGRQVAFDIDILSRTIAQRDDANTTLAMRVTLDLADHLAARALAPAIRHKWIEETAVLTYFQKAPTVRLFPYAPLALIGFDIVAIQDSARLLAIAHEAGHQVFRQMTINYLTNVDEQVEARAEAPAPEIWPQWLLAWDEEIFADVYSALVAGPVAGLAMQSMLMSSLPAALTRDDGDHPLPALRPALFASVLHRQAVVAADAVKRQRLENAATALEINWRTFAEERQVARTFEPADGSAPVALGDALILLDRYVGALLDDELSALAGDYDYVPWSDGVGLPDDGELSDLYAQFATTVLQVREEVLPEMTVTAGGRRVKVTPHKVDGIGGERMVGQIGDPYLDRLRDEALLGQRRLTPDVWKAVFLAGDWVTEEGGSGITPIRRRVVAMSRRLRRI